MSLDSPCGCLRVVAAGLGCHVLTYASSARPGRVHEQYFPRHVAILTTHGRWQVHGRRGEEAAEPGSLLLGAAGDAYSCRHEGYDRNVILSLAAPFDEPPLVIPQNICTASAQMISIARDLSSLKRYEPQHVDSVVLRLFDDIVERPKRTTISWARLEYARSIIATEYTADLQRLGQRLQYSPFHLQREFVARYGMSPHQYLQSVRMKRARELLECSKKPVGEIACELNFASASHFVSGFRAATGVTPLRYRNVTKA